MNNYKKLGIIFVSTLLIVGCGKKEEATPQVNNVVVQEETTQLNYLEMQQQANKNIQEDKWANNQQKYESDMAKIEAKKNEGKPPLFYITQDHIGSIKGRELYYNPNKAKRYTDQYLMVGNTITEEDIVPYLYYLLALVGESNENYLVYLDKYRSELDIPKEISWFNDYSAKLLDSLETLSKTHRTLEDSGVGQVIDEDISDAFKKIEGLYLDYRDGVYEHIRKVTNYQGDYTSPQNLNLTDVSKDKISNILQREEANNQ